MVNPVKFFSAISHTGVSFSNTALHTIGCIAEGLKFIIMKAWTMPICCYRFSLNFSFDLS